ncbi:MAG: hypothetical protein ACOYEV_10080 [Candidatus Nanopelagicales bacterium]
MDVPEERRESKPPEEDPARPQPVGPAQASQSEDERFAAEWSAIVEDLTSQGVGMVSRESSTAQPPVESPSNPPGGVPRGDRLLGFAVWLPQPESRSPSPPPPAPGRPFDDGEHFIPAPPPALPAGTPVSRLAWLGTLGGPAVLISMALTGMDLPRVVAVAAGLAFLAGFSTLVWLLPDQREDGWDDGAQV